MFNCVIVLVFVAIGMPVIYSDVIAKNKSVLLTFNKQLLLECETTETTESIEWQWLYNKETIDDHITSDGNQSRYEISNADFDDVGDYVCRYQSSEANISVRAKPMTTIHHVEAGNVIVNEYRSAFAFEEDEVTFACHVLTAVNQDIRSLSWQVAPESDASKTVEIDDEYCHNHPEFVVTRDASDQTRIQLQIKNVNSSHRNFYFCKAENIIAEYKSQVLLRIKEKLAPLKPFFIILAEIVLLIFILFITKRFEVKKLKNENENGLEYAKSVSKAKNDSVKSVQNGGVKFSKKSLFGIDRKVSTISQGNIAVPYVYKPKKFD